MSDGNDGEPVAPEPAAAKDRLPGMSERWQMPDYSWEALELGRKRPAAPPPDPPPDGQPQPRQGANRSGDTGPPAAPGADTAPDTDGPLPPPQEPEDGRL
jgi:hypothetical protein